MRGTPKLSYVIDVTRPVPEIFKFIALHSGNDESEMYSNYNMGAGYAVYLSATEAVKACEIAKNCGLKAWIAGKVEKGSKQVVIKPKNIVFSKENSLLFLAIPARKEGENLIKQWQMNIRKSVRDWLK